MVSARTWRQQSSLDDGVFQCEGPCRRILPTTLLVEQDGRWKCRERCAHTWSKSEDAVKLAEGTASTDTQERASLRGVTTPFEGAKGITRLSPRPLELTAGGSAGTLSVTGVGLATGDTWDYGHASITGTVTVTDENTVSISVTAAGGVPSGYYTLTYDSDNVFRRAFLVH